MYVCIYLCIHAAICLPLVVYFGCLTVAFLGGAETDQEVWSGAEDEQELATTYLLELGAQGFQRAPLKGDLRFPLKGL